MRRVLAVSFALCLVLSMSACAEGAPDGDLAVAVESQLRPQESDGEATVDFDALVDGDWTQLALICGASPSTITEALGFDWVQPEESAVRSGFAYVFATADQVEQYFGPVTWAPFDDRVYVSSCHPGSGGSATVLLFERRDATIRYELRQNHDTGLGKTWFPASEQGTAFGGPSSAP